MVISLGRITIFIEKKPTSGVPKCPVCSKQVKAGELIRIYGVNGIYHRRCEGKLYKLFSDMHDECERAGGGR